MMSAVVAGPDVRLLLTIFVMGLLLLRRGYKSLHGRPPAIDNTGFRPGNKITGIVLNILGNLLIFESLCCFIKTTNIETAHVLPGIVVCLVFLVDAVLTLRHRSLIWPFIGGVRPIRPWLHPYLVATDVVYIIAILGIVIWQFVSVPGAVSS